MKFLYVSMLAILMNTAYSTAQSSPVTCKIRYSYDVSGNRIKREYGCEQAPNPGNPVPYTGGSLLRNLSPNPTTGMLTGVFSKPVSATVVITNMSGIIILSQHFPEPIPTFTINLAQAVPGNYLVTIAAAAVTESYTVTKL